MKSDIFFFITSVCVVALTILLSIILVYVIKIMKDFREVSTTVKKSVNNVNKNITAVARKIKRKIIN